MPNGRAATALAAGRSSGRLGPVAALLICAFTLVVAFLNKARCAGPPFRSDGRSQAFDIIKDARVCYSDIQYLWLGRDIDQHVFPYIHGAMTPDGALVGGAVEYPVLSGVLMWLGALGADTDAMFLLQSALLLAPFALLTAWLLARMAGRRALLWAAGPPLVLYAFHNWELPVVCTAVAAFFLVTTSTFATLRTRAMLAAVLLGLGFCLKIYPAIFVLPLMMYVLTGGTERVPGTGPLASAGRRYDVRGALMTGAAAIGAVVAVNLPFALAGYTGWRASIEFQQLREADITTNSIWYWGLRPLFGSDEMGEATFQHTVSIASPALVVAAFGLALWLGWKRFETRGVYPWIGVSGAMLCGFLFFHKVHSPQYTLWLIPFLVLLAVPRWTVVAYLIADIAIGIGVFRYFDALASGTSVEVMTTVVQFGVWGRAVLAVVLFGVFLRVPPSLPRGGTTTAENRPADLITAR